MISTDENNEVDPLLTVRQLSCERDDRLLFRGLDLSVSAGEVVQIQGANGSGKTTLLRILCGLNDEYQGEILWQGKQVQQCRSQFREALFYLGHSPAIKRMLTPLENLRWFSAAQGQGDDEAISAALKRFGLAGYETFPCYLMSAGQQRRVSLARLCLSKARLWVLDEPFTALDSTGVEMLEGFLAEHARTGGAVVLSTHHDLRMACPVKKVLLGLQHSAAVTDVEETKEERNES